MGYDVTIAEREAIGMSDQDVLPGAGESPGEGPADLSPPSPEDLLGLRIAAALIDLVLLAGVLVILSAAVGQTSVSGGSFNVSLSGAWGLVFLAIVLLYYFALEAWAGQTLGKRLFGLQVLRAGGTRPSAGAVALRTLLRIVDWLPLLYLVGFIAVLATGTRRQRLGDLAARTAIARAQPARHRALSLVPLAIVLLAAVALSVYRVSSAGPGPAALAGTAGGTQTYQGHGVSFDYPGSWFQEAQHGSVTGNLLWATAVGPATEHDLIIVESYRVKIPITARNIDALVPEMAGAIRDLGIGLHGTPQKMKMAGLPAYRFQASGVADGTAYRSTLVFAFKGTTEYFVNCQYTPAKAAEVKQACNQVTGSFRVG